MGSSGGSTGVPGAVSLNTAQLAAAAIPAAVQEGVGTGSAIRRQRLDCSRGIREWRCAMQVNVAASAAAKAAVQYSTDNGATWRYLDGVASGSTPVSGFVSMAAATNVVSAWIPLPASARADVLLRPVTVDGDGTTTGSITGVSLQWR